MAKSNFPVPLRQAEALMRLGMRSTTMMVEAQTVIAMRMMGMMGFWPMHPGEGARMLSEKLEALQEAQLAVMKSAARGGSAVEVTEAALRPLRRRTRANAARLVRESAKS